MRCLDNCFTRGHVRRGGGHWNGSIEKVQGQKRVKDRGEPRVTLLRLRHHAHGPPVPAPQVQSLLKSGASAQEDAGDGLEVLGFYVELKPPHGWLKESPCTRLRHLRVEAAAAVILVCHPIATLGCEKLRRKVNEDQRKNARRNARC